MGKPRHREVNDLSKATDLTPVGCSDPQQPAPSLRRGKLRGGVLPGKPLWLSLSLTHRTRLQILGPFGNHLWEMSPWPRVLLDQV